jgi:hypothetical protein
MFVGFINRLLLKNTPTFGKINLFMSSDEDIERHLSNCTQSMENLISLPTMTGASRIRFCQREVTEI